MNVNRKTAVILGGLVFLSVVIATAIFLLSGSQGVIYFGMVGIPLIVVIGVGAYVKGVIAQSGTSEEQFVTKRARSISQEFQTVLREFNEIKTNYPKWDPGVETQINSIAGDFEKQGVQFDIESGSFEISDQVKSSEIEEFERLSGEINTLESNSREGFTNFASSELASMNNILRELDDKNLLQSTNTISTSPGRSLDDAMDTLDDAHTTCSESIDTAIETVRNIGRGETRAQDLESIDAELEDAKTFAQQRQYDSSLNSILEARDKLRNQFSGSFKDKKESIENLVEAIDQSNVQTFVDPDSIDEFEKLIESISGLDSALDLSELSQTESRVRRVAEDMVATIEYELDKKDTTLNQANLPAGYYTTPEALEERYLSRLEQTDSLNEFTQTWIEATEKLTDELDTAQTKVSVVEAYDDVKDTIQKELSSTGEVSAEDLPMKNADQFLGLYYRKKDGVDLVQGGSVLRRGDVETHKIKIDISYEKGSEEERTATIELHGGGYNKTRSISTRVAGSTTFEDVPEGVVTLSADPGDDGFSSISRDINIEGQSGFDLTFSEQELQEQLCEDIDANLEEVLSDMRNKLDTLFTDNGHLSTDMDLPIRDLYQPCLFALWSEETGNSICRDGDEILVYDGSEARDELGNVLQYNAEPGEILEHTQIRRNFLSAPLPDSVIKTEIMDINSEYELRPVGEGIEVK